MTRKASVCVEIEPQIQAVAAREAEPEVARRVEQHLQGCTHCQTQLDRYRHIESEVEALRNPVLAQSRVAAARQKLHARLADLRSRLVAYEVLSTPFGRILLAASEHGLVLVGYLERGQDGARAVRAYELEPVENGGRLDPFSRELKEYLEGHRTRLEWPLDLKLVRSPFQRTVLEATAAIPYGAVMSYAGLAHEMGRPQAVRAAAQALRWNPLAIVIPCHRVVGSSGALTGYAGRHTAKKQRLLAIEGVPTAKALRDFRIRPEAMYVLSRGSLEYCLPTCASLESETRTFALGGRLFASRNQAEAAGFAACTTCRPDQHPLPS